MPSIDTMNRKDAMNRKYRFTELADSYSTRDELLFLLFYLGGSWTRMDSKIRKVSLRLSPEIEREIQMESRMQKSTRKEILWQSTKRDHTPVQELRQLSNLIYAREGLLFFRFQVKAEKEK